MQIELSYFGHPVKRFSILPSRAPACHSVRECFRFRRPKGNNPSFRSLDHVEDRVSFAEYYGFLYSDMHVYRVHSTYPYVSTECTCVSLAPPKQAPRVEIVRLISVNVQVPCCLKLRQRNARNFIDRLNLVQVELVFDAFAFSTEITG